MPSGFKTTWRKFFIEYEDFGHTECAIECGISLELEIEKNWPGILIDFGPCMDNAIDYCDNEFTVYHTDGQLERTQQLSISFWKNIMFS